jgi:hypothetical protein
MDFSRLEQNICDVIKEEQVKLGYRREAIRLYYPLQSLNRFLDTALDEEGMQKALADFPEQAGSRLGTVDISHRLDRFCFSLSPEATVYVHEHTPQKGFLYDFIHTVSQHDVTVEEVIEVFCRYSQQVHVEKAHHGEFDYLVYFESGEPDDYRYCLTQEGHHMIYHRFTPADYKDFAFEG